MNFFSSLARLLNFCALLFTHFRCYLTHIWFWFAWENMLNCKFGSWPSFTSCNYKLDAATKAPATEHHATECSGDCHVWKMNISLGALRLPEPEFSESYVTRGNIIGWLISQNLVKNAHILTRKLCFWPFPSLFHSRNI